MNGRQEEGFRYTYCAPTEEERKAIEEIRNRYLIHENTETMQKLKDLDAKVKRLPGSIALACGILGTLAFGAGLAMILQWSLFISGSFVAFLGAAAVVAAKPLYVLLYKKRKNRYRDEILQLCDALLEEKENGDS